jgi:cobalt/nickel transport system ATP-binding protein
LSKPAIQLEEISYSYPDGTPALRDLSVEISAGSKVAVLGANGSGKTTMFLCLNGLLRPQLGSIYFNGQRVTYDKKFLRHLRAQLGIVFQDPDTQLFSADLLQEVAFGPLNLGLSREEVHRRVEKAMRLTGIWELRHKPTHLLSYGQKKRVSIADILAMEPAVVVCDEPTAWLDQEHASRITALFDEINSAGTTVIISTHDSDLAFSFADQVVLLAQGTVLRAGTSGEIFGNADLLEQAGLRRPQVLDIYLHLVEKGLIKNSGIYPRTMDELKGML